MQPYTIQYGPWAPDLANIAVQMQYQFGATPVPCADCDNVYFADGTYKSLPTPAAVSTALSGPCLGAFTAIAPNGDPAVYAATENWLYLWNGVGWSQVGPFSSASGLQWAFAQYGSTVYAVTGSQYGIDQPFGVAIWETVAGAISPRPLCGALFEGSATGTTLTVTAMTFGALAVGMALSLGYAVNPQLATVYITAFGTGTGGIGTYTLSASASLSSGAQAAGYAPVGNVIATAGQFLVLGDIRASINLASDGAYALGTGNASTKSFSGILPWVPVFGGTVIVGVSGSAVATDNGSGVFSNASLTGTIDYETGAIAVTFVTAPASGAPITVGYATAWPSRVWWSGVDAPTLWPVPLTNPALAVQSSYEDLPTQYGAVMFIAPYPLYMVILQRTGITTASYVGGAVVFSFAQISQTRGLVARGAAVQVGPITYFLSDEGFFETDGANVVPIGTAPDNSGGIDHWFWTNVNLSALNAIRAAYDARTRNIYFAICTGTNTTPDTLLAYNPLAKRWTRTTGAPCGLIWTDSDGTTQRLALINTSAEYALLTGAPAAGYLESCDVMFTDANARYCTGVRPNVDCTDSPQSTIGTRNTLSSAVTYSAATAVDAFTGIAPMLAEGIYMRARLTSAAAQAYHGATLMLETGGPV